MADTPTARSEWYTCCHTKFPRRADALAHLMAAHGLNKDRAYRKLRSVFRPSHTGRPRLSHAAPAPIPASVDSEESSEETCVVDMDTARINSDACYEKPPTPYVRQVCTCAAGCPECPACIDWRLWHPHTPNYEETEHDD